MSDELVAPIITVAVLVFLCLWVPTLHLCDGCLARFHRRRAERKAQTLSSDVDELA